jgi:formylglycine-generating enzyme required for sulfatase activity
MSAYPWGSEPPAITGTLAGTQLCWSGSASVPLGGPCPVGSFGKTLLGGGTCLGVADLAGDVFEWTQAEYHDPYVYPEPVCNVNSSACSLRGGSWGNADAAFFTSSYRYDFGPTYGTVNFGFRCARSAGPTP